MIGTRSGHPQHVIRGRAFVQNIRRGRYLFDHDTDPTGMLEGAFGELRSALEC